MRRATPSPREQVPNLAPMVDVIMVILVFFMLGASLQLAREGVLRTELDPRSGPADGQAIEIIPAVKVTLTSTPSGAGVNLSVMGRSVTGGFSGLRRLLGERMAAGADTLSPVVIAADPRVRWKFVVAAMDATIAAGFGNVQFSVGLDTPPVNP